MDKALFLCYQDLWIPNWQNLNNHVSPWTKIIKVNSKYIFRSLASCCIFWNCVDTVSKWNQNRTELNTVTCVMQTKLSITMPLPHNFHLSNSLGVSLNRKAYRHFVRRCEFIQTKFISISEWLQHRVFLSVIAWLTWKSHGWDRCTWLCSG